MYIVCPFLPPSAFDVSTCADSGIETNMLVCKKNSWGNSLFVWLGKTVINFEPMAIVRTKNISGFRMSES